jgi:anthranilate phosphoribosyltransferase
VRRELGVRTLFNIVAPLANPAGVERQTVGVSDAALAPRIADVLAHAGTKRAWVFRGDDGLDELSTTATSRVWDVNGGVSESEIDPAALGFERATMDDLRGGSAGTNARIATETLQGAHPRVADAVVLNAAAALVVAGSASGLADGIERARESIASGAATRVLERLREVSQRAAG